MGLWWHLLRLCRARCVLPLELLRFRCNVRLWLGDDLIRCYLLLRWLSVVGGMAAEGVVLLLGSKMHARVRRHSGLCRGLLLIL